MNCQKDDLGDSSNVPTAKNYTVETKTVEQLKSYTKLKNSISPFLAYAPTGKLETRSNLEDKNEFTIDSTEVRVIKGLKGYTSYTFGILREHVKDDSFENIVFEYDDNSSIPKVSVIKYNVNTVTQNYALSEVFILDFLTGARTYYMADCWTLLIEYTTSCPWQGQHPYGTSTSDGCAGGWEEAVLEIEVCKWVTPSTPDDVYVPGGSLPGSGISPVPAHGHGGLATGGTPSTSPVPLNTPAYNRKKLLSKLTPEGMAYFFASSEATQGTVLAFLQQHSNSDLAFEILVGAIESAEEYNVPIEKILKMFNGFAVNKQCQFSIIYNSLLKAHSVLEKKIQAEVYTATDVGVHMSHRGAIDMPNFSVMAVTNANFGSVPGIDTPMIPMVFNNTLIDTSTDFGLYLVTQHELLHAYFILLYKRGALLTKYPAYTALNSAFANFYANPSSGDANNELNLQSHNVYIDFIDEMAVDVVAYATRNNISGVDLEYAKRLVWGGLQATNLFNTTTALTLNQRYLAQLALNNEIKNEGIKKGTKTCP